MRDLREVLGTPQTIKLHGRPAPIEFVGWLVSQSDTSAGRDADARQLNAHLRSNNQGYRQLALYADIHGNWYAEQSRLKIVNKKPVVPVYLFFADDLDDLYEKLADDQRKHMFEPPKWWDGVFAEAREVSHEET